MMGIKFNGANATDSLNFKSKITCQTVVDNNNDGNVAGRVDVEIMVPWKYITLKAIFGELLKYL